MIKLYTCLFILLIYTGAEGQNFSIGDLVNFTAFPSNKFDALVSRKGYKPHPFQSDVPAYYKTSKDKTLETLIARQDASNAASVTYQTTSLSEFHELKEELKKAGFTYSETRNKENIPLLFQKDNITVQPVVKEEDEKITYSFLIERKALPKSRDIIHAEDLLQLSSHEYLKLVYGEDNVKKDQFYFSENEMNQCSVLFPNTNRQIIFIWEDEVNHRTISMVLFGGNLRTQGTSTNHSSIEQNAWHSDQGIHSGMSLKELVAVNEQPLYFYGWETEQPGLVLKKNTGKIDFNKIGIVLNCLDCNEDRYYTKNNTISSTNMLKENRRIYVSTIVLLPHK